MTDLDLTLTPAQWEHLDRHDWTLTDAPAGVVPRTVGIVRPERHLVGWSDYYGRHSNGASDPCPTGRAASCPVCVVIPAERVGTATVTAVPVVEARRIPNGSDTPADHDGPYVRVRPTGTVELIPYEGRHHLGGLGGRRGARMWGVPVNATALFATPPEPGDTVWRLDKENQ